MRETKRKTPQTLRSFCKSWQKELSAGSYAAPRDQASECADSKQGHTTGFWHWSEEGQAVVGDIIRCSHAVTGRIEFKVEGRDISGIQASNWCRHRVRAWAGIIVIT